MGFAINTNNDALNTYRNLTNVQNSLSKSLERLSSGLRINQAGDDAAGLTIATQLGSQVSGLQQASRNAQDGTSVVQTADGALSQAQSLLGRLRDLAVQAGNDSNSPEARAAIKTEADSITDELTRLGNSVSFNGIKLLNGSANLKFQVGADGNTDNQVGVDLSGTSLVTIASGLKSAGSTTSGYTVADLFTKGTGSGAVDGKAVVSSVSNGVTTSVTLTGFSKTASVDDTVTALNANAAFSSKYIATKVTDSTSSSTYYVGIVAKDGGTVSATADGASTAASTHTAVSGGLDYTTASGAQTAIGLINTQISALSTARANIGALENRFNNAISTISTTVQNLTAAKSRITDVDMASEMVNYTRANVLSQSGTAMLAQANSLPQLALKLLG